MMLGVNLSQLLHGCAACLQAVTIDTAVDCYANGYGTLFVFLLHDVCLFVFLALQPIVIVFSQPGSGL